MVVRSRRSSLKLRICLENLAKACGPFGAVRRLLRSRRKNMFRMTLRLPDFGRGSVGQ
jgi:hypothetical protein